MINQSKVDTNFYNVKIFTFLVNCVRPIHPMEEFIKYDKHTPKLHLNLKYQAYCSQIEGDTKH